MDDYKKYFMPFALGALGAFLLPKLWGKTLNFRTTGKERKNPYAHKYILEVGTRIEGAQMDLAEATSNQFPRQQRMMGGRDSAEMMKNFIRMTNAKRGIEVGVFTGYTTLAFALAVPEDGHIYAIDFAGPEAFNNGNEFTKLGEEYWKKCGVSDKITLNLDGGTVALKKMVSDPKNHGTFDFAFVDANKEDYTHYHEFLMTLLKPRGWICYDNTLWGYSVIGDPAITPRHHTEEMKAFNMKLRNDERVDISMLDIADGVTLVVKR